VTRRVTYTNVQPGFVAIQTANLSFWKILYNLALIHMRGLSASLSSGPCLRQMKRGPH
jgi:hypothetical protein